MRSPLETWFRQSGPAAQVRAAAGLADQPRLGAIRDDAALAFEDVSLRPRFGCKGPGAQAWLVTEGYRVPAAANSVVIDATGVLVARLATSEFLIEAVEGGAGRVASNQQQLTNQVCPADVYPVARQDLVIAVEGAAINTLLRQICSFDFAPLLERCEREAGPIVFTSMVGVSVLALVRRVHVSPVLTLWVDPTFAHYFWTTLLQVGNDFGGINVNATTGSME